jgi:hypothetical protein
MCLGAQGGEGKVGVYLYLRLIQILIPVSHFVNGIALFIAIKDYLYHIRPKHTLLSRNVDDKT